MIATFSPATGSRLGRVNPAAKLVSASVVLVGLLVTVDILTASIVLGCELIALPFTGVSPSWLLRRSWPVLLGASGVALANLIAGVSATDIAAVSLRLLGITIPGVLVFASTEPVDLTDSLVQQLRVPARFAYSALAAFRLLPLLSSDWQTIQRARRARGLDAGRSPLSVVKLFGSAAFALLVAAVRRGSRLAAAMDSRGFDSEVPRTFARRQRARRGDWLLLAITIGVVAGANVIAAIAGTWHPLLG